MTLLLDVNDLHVKFKTYDGWVTAINQLSFKLEQGKTLGIVGESGAGKSQTAYAILGILAKNADVSGSIKYKGKELIGLKENELNKIRSNEISIIFQDAMTSLNPYLKIGTQLIEVLRRHQKISYQEAFNQSIRMLDAVKIHSARKKMSMYVHELSGGMRQRVVIAMSLLCQPKLIIADEPTTALDVTVQAQIIALLEELKKEFNTTIILITHDLGVVAGFCDHVLVMYAGKTMEYGKINNIFYETKHPYTRGLLKSIPRMDCKTEHLFSIKGNPPNLLDLSLGCPFEERCLVSLDMCKDQVPPLQVIKNKEHFYSCFLGEQHE